MVGRFVRHAAFVLAVLGLACGSSTPAPGAPAVSTRPPPPACRLRAASPAVIATANEALRRAGARHRLPLTRVVVNPPEPVDGATLALYLVADARADETDELGCALPRSQGTGHASWDHYSVTDICIADRAGVRCSADAVAAIEAVTPGRAVSPFLFFLLRHELAHVALGHPGAYNAERRPPTGLDRAGKLALLAASCSSDADDVRHEADADGEAIADMTIAFGEPPFAAGQPDRTREIADNTQYAYAGAMALDRWAMAAYGATFAIGPQAYEVCPILAEGSTATLPALGRGHPHIWSRLSAFLATMSQLLVTLRSNGDLGLGIDSLSESLDACMMEIAVKRFCGDVAAARAGRLDCASHRTQPASYDTAECGDDERPNELAVHAVAPRLHRDVTDRATAQLLSLSFHEHAATVEAAARLAAQLDQALDKLDRALVERGGYVLHLQRDPVEWRRMANGVLDVTGSLRAIVKTTVGFDVTASAGFPATWTVVVHQEPWSALWRHLAIRLSDAAQHDAKVVLTDKLRVDELFDVNAALRGSPNAIDPRTLRLLCFLHSKIDAHYQPTAGPRSSVAIALFGDDTTSHDDWHAWRPLAVPFESCQAIDLSDLGLQAAMAGRINNLQGPDGHPLPEQETLEILLAQP